MHPSHPDKTLLAKGSNDWLVQKVLMSKIPYHDILIAPLRIWSRVKYC